DTTSCRSLESARPERSRLPDDDAAPPEPRQARRETIGRTPRLSNAAVFDRACNSIGSAFTLTRDVRFVRLAAKRACPGRAQSASPTRTIASRETSSSWHWQNHWESRECGGRPARWWSRRLDD